MRSIHGMHRITRMEARDLARAVEIEEASPGASAWDETSLRQELERAWAYVWVARRDDGASGVGEESDESTIDAFAVTWIVADELHILNVATHPKHRRRGLGRALLDHARAFAFERGALKIVLEVRCSNEGAIALYRQLGLRAMNVRRRYYPDGEDALDMLAVLDATTGAPIDGPDECVVAGDHARSRGLD